MADQPETVITNNGTVRGYDTPDIKGQHRLIVFDPSAGDRRYLNQNIYPAAAQCGKCHRAGIDLSLLPCTSGPFGTGKEL